MTNRAETINKLIRISTKTFQAVLIIMSVLFLVASSSSKKNQSANAPNSSSASDNVGNRESYTPTSGAYLVGGMALQGVENGTQPGTIWNKAKQGVCRNDPQWQSRLVCLCRWSDMAENEGNLFCVDPSVVQGMLGDSICASLCRHVSNSTPAAFKCGANYYVVGTDVQAGQAPLDEAMRQVGQELGGSNNQGTYGGNSRSSSQCNVNSECSEGQYCNNGACKYDCKTDRDCNAGMVCDTRNGMCAPGGGAPSYQPGSPTQPQPTGDALVY